ncbi:hypothetical protein EOK75_17170 (plasmid) [Pseudorhodobacter turbinis]|uniref:Uncharacterized protein n=1 Tax=Pseudorhodobacter turbinis TaxID=2500533 RepID=A0A4P8EKZ1_9RHOB|nr:hypothetical protein [Pseudorhodobacter turbinis]QCO57445.1 hypothetical protein EOK75_17170 [Pseudorhodobacter turbinis]
MKTLFSYKFALIFIWLLIFTFNNLFGMLEGKFMPVVENFTIMTTANSEVFGTYDKVRNCTLDGSKWYYTEDNDRIPARLESTGFTQNRKIGFYSYGPWKISIEEELIEDHSYILVTHKCHPLWNTVTKLYP